MNVIFHHEAQEEFIASALYYEERVDGLGMDFHEEVLRTIQNALQHPDSWPDIGGGIRRCLVRKFPYAVLYDTTPSEFFVYAVMNLHRHPDYWKHRR